MPVYFAQCTIPEIKYRGDIVKNNPVNLALCKSIEKTTFRRYPDNNGKPAIKLNGCDKEWVFNEESVRDSEFERLASLQVIAG